MALGPSLGTPPVTMVSTGDSDIELGVEVEEEDDGEEVGEEEEVEEEDNVWGKASGRGDEASRDTGNEVDVDNIG